MTFCFNDDRLLLMNIRNKQGYATNAQLFAWLFIIVAMGFFFHDLFHEGKKLTEHGPELITVNVATGETGYSLPESGFYQGVITPIGFVIICIIIWFICHVINKIIEGIFG